VLLAVEAEADRIAASDRAEQWEAVVDANATLGRRPVQAYGSMRLAVTLLRHQARSRAEIALRAAHDQATALGATPLVAEIRTVARLGGLRLETGADRGPGPDETAAPAPSALDSLGLTPRECEVLALLTTGATNRMIARTLFISERTASVHVSNLLPKLGVANRTEAARLALRLDLDSPGATGR
jgi:DNA-binding NarL/FixJ family response regulator